jgi:hypothetical protein
MDNQNTADLKQQLKAIQLEIKELNAKVERLLVGENGHDGVIGRMTRQEERLSGTRGVVALLGAALTIVTVFLIRLSVLWKGQN